MCSDYEWERICEEQVEFEERRTYRMRVDGGSLYRYELNTPNSEDSRETCVSMVFVPEPDPPIRGCRVKRRKARVSGKER